MGGGAIGMLVFLEHWAREQDIQFKLFNLSQSVFEGLAQTGSASRFEITTFHEMMDLLTQSDYMGILTCSDQHDEHYSWAA